MIPLRAPTGNGNYVLRGIMTPSGPKTIANMRFSAVGGGESVPVDEADAVDALTVTADPDAVVGAVASASMTRVTTSVALVTSNGVAPFTYQWTQTVGGGGWSVRSPTSSGTAFRVDVAPESSETAEFECTVTDAVGATGTATASATAYNYGGSGGI